MKIFKLIMLSIAMTSQSLAQETLTLYSNREPALIKAISNNFTKSTGIKVDVLYLANGLLERLAAEGKSSKADIVYVADITTAELAKERGLTQILSSTIGDKLPPLYRSHDWLGLTLRTRVIFASKERFKANQITYDELADPKYKGQICMRQGSHPYNLALISAAITQIPETENWLKGLRANLARKPSGGDRDVAKDIYAGLCDIGIANSYYLGLMANDPKQAEWASSIKLINPTFKAGGTHINLSAAFIPANAPQKALSERFLTYALSQEAQAQLSHDNFEFPTIEGVPLSEQIKAWANFTADKTPLQQIAKNRKLAAELLEKVGFDR